MVKHSLLFDAPIDFSQVVGSGTQKGVNPYQAEIVSFAVIENAARDITSGHLFPFTMGYNLRGNMAFFPKVLNALTNNLFRGVFYGGNTFDTQNHFAPHIQNIAHLPEVVITPEIQKAVNVVAKNTLPDGSVKPSAAAKVAGAIWEGVKSLVHTTTGGWANGAKYGVPAVLSTIGSLLFKDEMIEGYAPVLKYTVVNELLETIHRIKSMSHLLPQAEQVLVAMETSLQQLRRMPDYLSHKDYCSIFNHEIRSSASTYFERPQIANQVPCCVAIQQGTW